MKIRILRIALGAALASVSLAAVTSAMAESMASHDATGSGHDQGGSASDGPDPASAWNYDPGYDPTQDPSIDPAHVIQWHDIQPDTEGNLFDYGPIMDDDGADTEE